MTIKLGILMDPISGVNKVKDSSLAMLRAAQKKGWQLWYMESQDLFIAEGKAQATMRTININLEAEDWYQLGEPVVQNLSSLNVILMRQDPPVDAEFIYNTQLLEMAEKAGTLVVNKTQALRDYNEKLFATQFPQCCPSLLVSANSKQLKAFHTEHQDVIFKPLDGMGGAQIFRVKKDGTNLGVILEILTDFGQQKIMAQAYIPEIKLGDKRVLMIDGEPVPYALARIPTKGETRGNLAAGGRAEGQPLTEQDKWICQQVGPVLKEQGLLFVGLDIIGDYLTEINVTSPTCIRQLDQQFGLDIGMQLMDVIESKLA